MKGKKIQVKTFKIRLRKKHNIKDLKKLNSFLKSVLVTKQYTYLISERNYLAMSIHYEEE